MSDGGWIAEDNPGPGRSFMPYAQLELDLYWKAVGPINGFKQDSHRNNFAIRKKIFYLCCELNG